MSGHWTTDEPEIGPWYWVRSSNGSLSVRRFYKSERWMEGKLQYRSKGAAIAPSEGPDGPVEWKDLTKTSWGRLERWSEPIAPPTIDA